MRKRGRKRGEKSSFLKRIFNVVTVIVAATLLLSYSALYINPEFLSFPHFFGLYFIPILCINLILCILCIWQKNKMCRLLIIVMLPSLLFSESFYKIGKSEPSKKSEDPLKVTTYNVGQFRSAKGGLETEETLSLIEKQLCAENPDVICLQEVSVSDTNYINKIFASYPYRVYHLFPKGKHYYFGNLTLSKLKMVSGGKITFEKSTNHTLYSDIVYHEDTIRVYNNHLESYQLSYTSHAEHLLISEEIKSVHKKVKRATLRRAVQVNKILDNIATSPYSTIICGDMNDTPMSYTYHRLKRGKKDTFCEAGRGFAATFRYFRPLLRIDYIFVPENYTVINHTTLKIPLSDHYPVIAEIEKD